MIFRGKSMIYARIWVVFLIEQFRIVDFQKGICALTRPLLLSVLPASVSLFIISLNWFPRVKLGWECVTSKHSETSCIMLHQSAAKFLEKQVKKKSIYRLIKQKSDGKKKRLAEISMSLFAFRCSRLLQLSTNYWLEHIYIGLLCQPIPLQRHKLPLEWKVIE